MAMSRHPMWTPMYYGGSWWDHPMVPHRIHDQHFGVGMHDDAMRRMEHSMSHMMAPYWLQPTSRGDNAVTGFSEVKNEKDKFQVNLDVKHFAPEELTVTTGANSFAIEGKHEEKSDEHGFVTRHFKRRYMLPKEIDPATIVSRLSADGVLTIEAPKKALPAPHGERKVAIEMGPTQPAIKHDKK